MTVLLVDRIATQIGEVVIVIDDARLCALDFADYDARMQQFLRQRYGAVRLEPCVNPSGFSERVAAYFAGDYRSLDAVPVTLAGTPFQQQVWQMLRNIQPGEVRTYGELATQLGRPKAARAVGMANSLNPVAIVIPCHRLIGANRLLTGYAGGLARKRWLLRHEGVTLKERNIA